MSASHKILLLITNLGKGGAQRVFHDHSLFLSERYAVEEAVFDKNEDQNLFPSGNKLHSLDVRSANGLWGKIQHFYQRCKRLKKVIATENIQLCISHMDGANWVNVLSNSSAKKILVVHGTILHDHNQKPWMQWLRRRLIIPFVYNRADITVAVSEGIKHELEKACGVRHVQAIPNYFEVEKIQQAARQPLPAHWESLFARHQTMVNSGRFNEQKKQRYLLTLLARLKSEQKNVKLILLGDGELRQTLLSEAEALQLRCYTPWTEMPFHEQYDVYFAGYSPNPFPYLSRSTLFVFPSGWEGFPMALCEAMISGVPVLTADCPTGPRQILAPGTFDASYSLEQSEQTPFGWLMPTTDKPGFEEEWYKVIFHMLGDQSLRKSMAAKAVERMNDFRKENVVNQWTDLIDSLLRKR